MLLDERKFYNHFSIAVPTPAATMFVFIIEDEYGKPFKIMIEAGKCGSEIAAVSYAMAEMASKLLENDGGYDNLLEMLSSVTTSNVKFTDGVPVHSCPEGLYVALLKYKQAKYNALESLIGSRKNFKPTKFRSYRE